MIAALVTGLLFHQHAAGTDVAAWAAAKPVLDKYCAKCHTTGGKGATPETLDHFNMDSYPPGGHHADEIGPAIKEVLGATGKEPTMPDDNPGVVKGEELEVVVAWADAWEHAHMHAGPEKAQLGFESPREFLIPGNPGPAGHFHLMVNGF